MPDGSGLKPAPTLTPTPTEARLRHPEKAHRPDNPAPPKPKWIRVKAPTSKPYEETRELMRGLNLHTVCEEAGCPNIGECWQKKHATFMIMGAICTRACSFCNVSTGKPQGLDQWEPVKIGKATGRLGLEHVVITSVDRDDLADGGAQHFVETIQAIRRLSPGTTIEILTPDFKNKPKAPVEALYDAHPDVFNHNLETVPRLYPTVRPGSRYFTSLKLLADAKARQPGMFTKSGLMVGLGETLEEVGQVMDDLRAADVDFLTIGQYLQPTKKHAALDRYWTPEEFDTLASLARAKGFLMVSSSPLTRSSYHAGDDFKRLQAARASRLAAG